MNILIVYGQTGYPLRASIREHLFCFERTSAKVFYFNASIGKFPHWIDPVRFDLVIFHHLFLSDRWTRNNIQFFEDVILKNVNHLKESAVKKVLLVQDDYFHTEAICRFVNSFSVSEVFSVAPPSEWEKLYTNIDRGKVRLHHVMTGYISPELKQKVSDLLEEGITRDVDIGYRAYKAPPWFGRFGFLKTRIAAVFGKGAPAEGFTTDISVEKEDTIYGDDWYRFLLRCKFVIGVEGGSAILDGDGSIWYNCERYIRENPAWTFDEVERQFFPGRDGEISLKAISPRHFESCLAKTCQVLIRGEYNGVLKAWGHYIPVEADFSNLREVFHAMKDEKKCARMIENAYHVACDEKNSYDYFVNKILEASGIDRTTERSGPGIFAGAWLIWLKHFHIAYNRYQHTGKHTVSTFIYSILVKIYVFLRPQTKTGRGRNACVE